MKIKKINVHLSEEQVEARVRELGAQISADYGDEPVCLICILKNIQVLLVKESITDLGELNFPRLYRDIRISGGNKPEIRLKDSQQIKFPRKRSSSHSKMIKYVFGNKAP